ncbi:MAG: kinase/pyrophosphorylase [Planctomycetaceae bacterium]|nr:kinase/pyrophosphorylase [Planctomycetaceae bacterium]
MGVPPSIARRCVISNLLVVRVHVECTNCHTAIQSAGGAAARDHLPFARLAYRGVRAADVPLIPGIEPPAELVALPHKRVVGLTAPPHRLRSVRESHSTRWGAEPPLTTSAPPRRSGPNCAPP